MGKSLQTGKPSAPVVDNLLYQAEHDCDVIDELTKALFFKFAQMMNAIPISGDDELRELWLVAPRGKIEEFANYDEYLAEGEVANRREFEERWLDSYPETLKWYRLAMMQYHATYSVFINRKLILKLEPEAQQRYAYEKSNLLNWLVTAGTHSIELINSGAYDDFVNHNLPYRHRIGKILRQDYWFIFPDHKNAYLAEMDADQIASFEYLINNQPEIHPAHRWPAMTSGLYFSACQLGYTANRFEGVDKLPAKALYQKHADGRDDGLLDLDEASAEAFTAWYFDREWRGGHPWEVCRGGNSTHISLYTSHDDQGWYFTLAGSSEGRSVETVKFYLALVKKGYPVYLLEGKEILAMLKGEDYIGIVPEGIFPRYCHSFFPGEKMLSFMNLPWDNTELMVKAAYWYPPDSH